MKTTVQEYGSCKTQSLWFSSPLPISISAMEIGRQPCLWVSLDTVGIFFFLTTWKTDLLCAFKRVPPIVWRQRHWGKRYFSVCLYMYKLPTHQKNILCNNPSHGSCVAISYANLAIFSWNHFRDKPFFLTNVQKTLIWGAEVVLF